MLIAQLSDLHFSDSPILDGRVDTAQMTRRAVDAILRLAPQPDAIIVTGDLTEGTTIPVGKLTVTAYETPGHCDGQLSFMITGADRRYLLGADLVFWGGRILLQNIHDCRIDAYANSVLKAEKLDFDALLPGHLQISLGNGKAHINAAAASFRQLGVPPNIM